MYGESQRYAVIGYADLSDFVIGSNLIWPTEMGYVMHSELVVNVAGPKTLTVI